MQIEEMTAEQVTARVRELLVKAQNGGISPAEKRELDSLQDVRSQTLAAKQARDRALQEYQDAIQPKVPNPRKNFSVAATAVTRQGLNDVGDYDSNFLVVQQTLEALRKPMTIENIVQVLSDDSIKGLGPNPRADELRQERVRQEREQLIVEILEDYAVDANLRQAKRRQLERPDITLENLTQQVAHIRERHRLREMTPLQIREENAARAAQQVSEKPIHVAGELHGLAGRQFPALPEKIWYEGKEVNLDSAFLRRATTQQLKKLIQTYGDQQVVARLRQSKAVAVFGE
jgi:hypothetical protein